MAMRFRPIRPATTRLRSLMTPERLARIDAVIDARTAEHHGVLDRLVEIPHNVAAICGRARVWDCARPRGAGR